MITLLIILSILYVTACYDSSSSNATCPPGCVSCTSDISCDACQINMQYIPSENACISCLTYGCVLCQSFTNCTQCSIEKINVFGTCADSVTINPLCVLCNQELSDFSVYYCYCEVCMVGYFDNEGVCVACGLYCESCVSADNCTACLPGYALDDNSSSCVSCPNADFCPETCQIGQFYNSTTDSCTACLPYCMYCHNTAHCIQCLPGFSLTKFELCNPCYPGCTNCSNLTECYSCVAGSTLYQADNMVICVLCPLGCALCQATNQTLICL